ncbi:MAG: alpha/beta hydrolase-fold protein [Erysipelotrichaceae bacterium]|nr:alpha/beta hydrolase-fold protein [Erysipelotrichaceae bacterium]MDY5252564.1 alpha/beta hydrolase-fold protein [Erysipelotrichaceae bacterium]
MIIKEEVWIEPFALSRMLHIYLPDDLEEDERLPVLYMFDGHNLFYDEDATYGNCWGLLDYLDKHHNRLMIVGLECNHEGNERLSEFSPYSFEDYHFGYIEGKGTTLITWMINELKPYIDHKYPTLTNRDNTYIGGSSMGGLMSLYMILKHSDIFSKAVVVSPHLYPLFKQLKKDLRSKMHPHTEVYISWGGKEYGSEHLLAMVTDQNLQVIRALMTKKQVKVIPYAFKNHDHSERSWRKELPMWFKALKL